MYDCLLKNVVPQNWQKVSYISLKSLASWYKDLHKRVDFMRQWLLKGHPNAYWLSGFFFPHGFMTGILQAYARKHLKAIDFLKFKFKIMDNVESESKDLNHFDEVDEIDEAPPDGVLIYGVYIEGAIWSRESQILEEQRPAVMITKMPVIHFEPYEV